MKGLFIYEAPWIPEGTIVIVPQKRRDETEDEWLDRCYMTKNLTAPDRIGNKGDKHE